MEEDVMMMMAVRGVGADGAGGQVAEEMLAEREGSGAGAGGGGAGQEEGREGEAQAERGEQVYVIYMCNNDKSTYLYIIYICNNIKSIYCVY
jgi:hypothetical protein